MDHNFNESHHMDVDPPSEAFQPRLDMRALVDIPLPSPPPIDNSIDMYEESMRIFNECQADFKMNFDDSDQLRGDQGDQGGSSSNTLGQGNTGLEDDRQELADLMKDDSNTAWMHDDVDPEEDDELTYWNEKFAILKDRRENNDGKFTHEDATEFMKAEKTLLLLNRLRNNPQVDPGRPQPAVEDAEETENELFIADSNPMSGYIPRDSTIDHSHSHISNANDMNDDLDDEFEIEEPEASPSRPTINTPSINKADYDLAIEQGISHAISGNSTAAPDIGYKKNGEPRKRRAPVAKDARAVYQQQQVKKAEKERKKVEKKKLKDAAKNKNKKGKGNTKKGKTVKNGESLLKSRSSWTANGIDEIGQRILRDLIAHDPIAERLSNPIFGVEKEPEIQGRHSKATQLQKLHANVPEGTSKATVRSDKAKLKLAAKSFGFGKVKAQDGKWLVAGMKSTIYHHQLLGAQWMVGRELSEQAPHGGLLADSMGLGKTIQTLALMVANKPKPDDIGRGIRATLIVCPATLVYQWIDEIRTHAEKETFPKVLHYKSTSKIGKEVLEDLDIVVTSYHEVMKQFPFPNHEEREEILQGGYAAWWKRAGERLGDLHKVNWYRVVLDEAHQIKNNAARTSLACQNLRSVFRWCLTGTPLMNRLEELFPYLRFLKADYTMDWKTFQRYFCDSSQPNCNLRIQTLLSYTMIRRTMDSPILGRPIITLPQPHPFVRTVQFSSAEKIIYRLTENRFRANINKFFEKGDAMRNYSVFMVQLLRLRQLTSHPWMIEQTMRDCWTLEDVQELKKRLQDISYADIPFYKQIDVWIDTTNKEREAAKEVRRNDDDEGHEIPLPFGQGDFGHAFLMDRMLDTLDEKEMLSRSTCGKCFDFPKPPVKTDCGHIFCRDCIDAEMHWHYSKDNSESSLPVCPTCEKLFTKTTDVHVKKGSRDFSDDMDDLGKGRRSKHQPIDPDSKGLDLMGTEPQTESTWVSMSDNTDDFKLLPSAKTTALKAILVKGFDDAPLDKVVIYVQFRTLARIVGRICKSEKWGFIYLTGDTTHEHRNTAIQRFRDDPNAKILIAGLKCGGLGLNFPFANRAISLDLWWNHAIEQQAFGRIFRIGQKKETYMTRIVVANSVDQRLLTMQLHKLQTCEKVIRDGTSSEKPSLSLKQLANLFGFLKTDEDDNIISVEPDYEDLREWEEGGAGRVDSEEL